MQSFFAFPSCPPLYTIYSDTSKQKDQHPWEMCTPCLWKEKYCMFHTRGLWPLESEVLADARVPTANQECLVFLPLCTVDATLQEVHSVQSNRTKKHLCSFICKDWPVQATVNLTALSVLLFLIYLPPPLLIINVVWVFPQGITDADLHSMSL